jgi:hypothetical protein
MTDAPPAPPAGNPPPAPAPAPAPASAPAPPADPPEAPAPSREEVIQNPQALIDALGSVRDDNRRMTRRIRDFERAERERVDAARTELERANDRATTAEGRLGQRELDNLRLEVALEQIIGDHPGVRMAMNLAPRLRGSTREELAQDAAQMRQLLGQQPAGQPPPGQQPPPTGGSRLGDGVAQQAGSDAAFNAMLRRAAGRG